MGIRFPEQLLLFSQTGMNPGCRQGRQNGSPGRLRRDLGRPAQCEGTTRTWGTLLAAAYGKGG